MLQTNKKNTEQKFEHLSMIKKKDNNDAIKSIYNDLKANMGCELLN